MDRLIIAQGQSDLQQVVAALQAAGRVASLNHRGKYQADQQGDDGNYDEQFDQSERTWSDLRHMRDSLQERLLASAGGMIRSAGGICLVRLRGAFSLEDLVPNWNVVRGAVARQPRQGLPPALP